MLPIAKRTFHNCQTSNIFISQKVDILPTNSSIFKLLLKFAPKFFVQQAICSCGLKCAPYITCKTLSSNLYMEECLKKRLLPFLKKA